MMGRMHETSKRPPSNIFSAVVLFAILYVIHVNFPGALNVLKGDFSSVSPLTDVLSNSFDAAKSSLQTLLSTQPAVLNIAVIECPGGTDKGPDGHRKDSKYLIQGLATHGANPLLIQYTDNNFEEAFNTIVETHKSHAFVSRVDPGEYDECSEAKYFEFLEALIKAGLLAYNSPNDMVNLGSKKSLLNLAGMYYFPNSTYLYSNLDQFDLFFPQTLKADGSRVIKQNRGSKGEGVWWVRIADKKSSADMFNPFKGNSIVNTILSLFSWSLEENKRFQPTTPVPDILSSLLPEHHVDTNACCSDEERTANLEEMTDIIVDLVEARDNHQEQMSLKTFRDKIVKHYLNSSADFLVDMEYLPRIAEGEVRLIVSGDNVLFIVNKQPDVDTESGAFSANLGAGATHKWETPENWQHLVGPFKRNLPLMLERMNVERPPILWTVDFIRYGELNENQGSDVKFVISEINASCVGFSANPEMGEVIAKILLQSIRSLLK